MTAEELNQVLTQWQLNAAQAAKVLCVHSNKLSEYLGGVTRIPCAVAFHVDALNHVPHEQREKMFARRINRKAHEGIDAG
jgi:hypothetical protein